MKRFSNHCSVSDEKQKLFLDMLITLECQVGEKATYKLMSNNGLFTYSITELNNSVKKMASFIGLESYAFIVIPDKLNSSNSGKIELGNDREIFISISKETLKNHESTLATLSHEITHKYIQVNSLTNKYKGLEAEIFTDLTSVYIGFGLLMLEGCEGCNSKIEQQYNGDSTIYEEIIKVGYICADEIAYIYSTICRMRGITKEKMLEGFSFEVQNLILRNNLLKVFPTLNEQERILNEKFEEYNNIISKVITPIYLIQFILDKARIKWKNVEQETSKIIIENTFNPVLKQLLYEKNIILLEEINNSILFNNEIKVFERIIEKCFIKEFNNINAFTYYCFRCGEKNEIAINKSTLNFKCNKCGKIIYIKTDLLGIKTKKTINGNKKWKLF